MMPGQKEQAEVLRHGLMAGVRTVTDAVAWADSPIAQDSHPDIAVIEVATVPDGSPPTGVCYFGTWRGSTTQSSSYVVQ